MGIFEKLIATIFLAILLPLIGWILSNIASNTERIAVLEQRTSNHMKAMDKMDADLENHRHATETLH